MPTYDLKSLFSSETPEARDAAATAFAASVGLADVVSAAQFPGHHVPDPSSHPARALSRATLLLPNSSCQSSQPGLKDTVIKQMKEEIADKGKAKANNRAAALRGARALVEKHGASAESVACLLLADAFEAMADKLKPVSIEADKFVVAFFDKLSPHAVKAVLPDVLREYDGKWQSNLGRAKMLKEMAEKFPKQMNRVLTSVIPVVSGLMWDTKAQVKEAAHEAMKKGEPLTTSDRTRMETSAPMPAPAALLRVRIRQDVPPVMSGGMFPPESKGCGFGRARGRGTNGCELGTFCQARTTCTRPPCALTPWISLSPRAPARSILLPRHILSLLDLLEQGYPGDHPGDD